MADKCGEDQGGRAESVDVGYDVVCEERRLVGWMGCAGKQPRENDVARDDEGDGGGDNVCPSCLCAGWRRHS